MPTKTSTCPHVKVVDSVTWEELRRKQQDCTTCVTCKVNTSNLWLCLVGSCQYVGCGESYSDHSSTHTEEFQHHLTINLTTLRIWCYCCETEVFPSRNTPSFIIPENSASVPIKKDCDMLEDGMSSLPSSGSRSNTSRKFGTDSSPYRSISAGEESDSEGEDENMKPRGLTGLQNLGNTCYLNAAIQALSNCPPLTRFFLDCSSYVRPEKSPMLSKSYMKLVHEIWHKKRPSYVIPNGVVTGIKVVHPMFRGYSQQDSQEFLRCFMDQIHEELKQPMVASDNEDDEEHEKNVKIHHRQLSRDSNSSSQSEECYESCDSGLSNGKNSAGISSETGENPNQMPNSIVSDGKTYIQVNNSDQDSGAGDSITSKESDAGSIRQAKQGSRGKDLGDLGKGDTEKGSNRARKYSENPDSKKSLYSSKATLGPKGNKKNVQYRSVISDIFDGKILSSVQCLTCERISTTKETFQDLSLPIPTKDHLHMIHGHNASSLTKVGACGETKQGWFSWMFGWMRNWFIGPTITLQDCLAAFFSADELKGDNMYSCEKCKKLRNGLKFSKVLELPEILCIHLKRFRHEFYSSKVSSYVSFPLDSLDMKKYLHRDCSSQVTLYDLHAVICHHGTAGGGHYTAYCLNYINDQWYEFDDQYVTEVDVGQVINCEAYVLFYRKRNDGMIPLRQKAMQLIEAREPSLMEFFISKQWINKFNTFAEPGPICNDDFLCKHGGVPPHKINHVDDLVISFNQALWEFLYQRFGGGPVCNHLIPCTTCQEELEKLQYRQKTEMDQFIQLNEKFHEEDGPSVIYAISMAWFKEWENFVRGKSDTPPGPIENQRISYTKGGQTYLRQNSDHGQLSAETWKFLHKIYGGGPELFIKQNRGNSGGQSPPTTHKSASSSTLGKSGGSRGNLQSEGEKEADPPTKAAPRNEETTTEERGVSNKTQEEEMESADQELNTSDQNMDTEQNGEGELERTQHAEMESSATDTQSAEKAAAVSPAEHFKTD
ncbi:ubiquitin carboxyl-terminal hydrolase 20-like [Saccostrea echinata]|uniref:ubiquitin carboxyl-terminal hydrolase 20-like n=1 Tax=Saccostrea echinata TaxID=191078 RepID=UPI002A83B843|nr:ubiquitin carboxyl-terminal hydrolase 20-like [Saccostrea echinata]